MGNHKLEPEMIKAQWKKGQSGNPSGRKSEAAELKAHRTECRNLYTTYLMQMIKKEAAEINVEADRPNIKTYEVLVLKLLTEAISTGSEKHQLLLLRLMKVDMREPKNDDEPMKTISPAKGLSTSALKDIREIIVKDQDND